jgi:hypothetical protein
MDHYCVKIEIEILLTLIIKFSLVEEKVKKVKQRTKNKINHTSIYSRGHCE